MSQSKIAQLIQKYEQKLKQLKTDQYTDDAMPTAKYQLAVEYYENFIKDLKNSLN